MQKRHVKIKICVIIFSVLVGMTGCDFSGKLREYLEQGAETVESSEREEEESSAKKDEPVDEIAKIRLIRVVDGDTLLAELDGQETYVRLIGVNTPESVASEEYLEKTGKENTEEGKAASNFVRELLSGTEWLYLEYDEEKKDQYDRTLGYVWLSEDRTDISNMLNARLIMEGHAETMTIRPNIKHAKELSALENDGK